MHHEVEAHTAADFVCDGQHTIEVWRKVRGAPGTAGGSTTVAEPPKRSPLEPAK